jgi:dipeptide/tripeptide permease
LVVGWFAGNETFEKLGTLGTSANLLVYLTQVFHMQSVDAATLLNGLNGTSSLAPIVGAFLSDAYLGRYLALAISTVASLIVSSSCLLLADPAISSQFPALEFALPSLLFLLLLPCRVSCQHPVDQ